MFTLAWGVPTMTLGLGLSPARAGAVLTLMTVAGIVVSPFAGVLSARAGSRRAVVGAVIAAVNIATWALFLAMVASQAFGAILEAHSRGGAYSWADFRVAWAAVVVVWFVWLVCFAVARRRVTAGAAPGGR